MSVSGMIRDVHFCVEDALAPSLFVAMLMIYQVKKADEPARLTRKQVAKNRFVKAGGGVEV